MGSIGPAVTAVQLALRNDGRDIQADGEFGPITFVALKAFEAAHGLPPDGIVDLPTAIALDKVAPPPSVLKVAPWLSTMRALTGTTEAPGSKDNPFIIEMAHEIVRRYPDLKGNVGWYNHDSIPWCGLGMGYVMAVNGIKPCDAPLSALAWASWGQKLKRSDARRGAGLQPHRRRPRHALRERGRDLVLLPRRQPVRRAQRHQDSEVAPVKAIRWPAGYPLPTAGRKIGVTGNAVKSGSEA
jgi:hypothetical protein